MLKRSVVLENIETNPMRHRRQFQSLSNVLEIDVNSFALDVAHVHNDATLEMLSSKLALLIQIVQENQSKLLRMANHETRNDDLAIKEILDGPIIDEPFAAEPSSQNGVNQHRKDESAISSTTETDGIPTEILRQVSLSGYLSSKELGRWLLLTSRKFEYVLGGDFLFKCLCESRWRNHLSHIPKSIVDAAGYRRIFRQLVRPCMLAMHETMNKPKKPKLSANDLVLMISIRDVQQDEEIISKSLSGPALDSLMKYGMLDISLLQNKGTSTEDSFLHRGDNYFQLTWHGRERFKATLHLLRLDREDGDSDRSQHICCIHETHCEDFSYRPSNHTGTIVFSPSNHPLQLTDQGKLFEHRLGMELHCNDDYKGLQFVVKLRWAAFLGGRVGYSTITPDSRRSMNPIEFTGLTVEAKRVNHDFDWFYYDSIDESQKTGVSLLNLLEELSGWTS